MIEAIVLGVVANVLGDYITGLLTNRQTERNRAELVGLMEAQIKATQAIGGKVEAMGLAVRELDVIVKKDRDLTWQEDHLVIRPSGRIRRSMPSPQDALDELVSSVHERRKELGLPITPEEAAGRAREPAEGDLIPPDDEPEQNGKPDLKTEVLNLRSEVLREKERRRRNVD